MFAEGTAKHLIIFYRIESRFRFLVLYYLLNDTCICSIIAQADQTAHVIRLDAPVWHAHENSFSLDTAYEPLLSVPYTIGCCVLHNRTTARPIISMIYDETKNPPNHYSITLPGRGAG